MRVALDAMGGDHAPGPIVAGAALAAASQLDLTILLVGDKPRIEAELARLDLSRERLELVHCTQTIDMGDSPVEALRKKPDNSISRCWQLLAAKDVDAIVSAGSTGAMVAAGLKSRHFLPHVRRPGIAAAMPTAGGACVILDVGANVSPKPQHLLQYGVMGCIFAKHILQRERPTIGLLNVGEEHGKGHDLARSTFALFQHSHWKDAFKGNVEGRDIHRGVVDVVVTDGFTGNVVLKLAEGVFEFIVGLIQKDVVGALSTERGKAAAALSGLLNRYHYSNFGGAPLLGIDGICIICHGASDARAISSAVRTAGQYARARLNELIVAELESLPAGSEEAPVGTA
jgi:glycerol-3-phosphate acyltransferase PlsX